MTMLRNLATRVVPFALLLVAALVAGLDHPACAEQSRRTSRRAAPASTAHVAPDVTGSLKSSKPATQGNGVQSSGVQGYGAAPQTQVLKNDDSAPLKPFDLPAAPRARMRQCGESWQKIKLSGEAGDRTWREFATACLAERPASPSVPTQNVSSAASR